MIEPRLVRTVDPVASAAALGVTRGAEIAADIDEAELAARRRLGLRRDGHRPASMPEATDGELVAELRQLSAELLRLERVRDHASERVAADGTARTPAATGLALHPETVLAASQAVVDAEADLAQAEAALTAARDHATWVLSTPPPGGHHAPRHRRGRLRRLLRPFRRRAGPPSTTPADLDAVVSAATVDHALAVVHAERLLDEAGKRWVSLTGPGTDPHDPGTVLRAHDPQHAYAASYADVAPALDALQALHRAARARWRVLWATLGADEPAPADADRVLDVLAAAEAQDGAVPLEDREAALRRPLVLVEPSRWTTAEKRLDRVLASLPADTEVVSIERLQAGGPAS